MKIVKGILSLSVLIFFAACSKESTGNGNTANPPIDNCAGADAKFVADVNPIIQSSCATNSSCHGTGSFNGPGALTSFAQIKNAGTSIKSAVTSGRMPKGSSLTTTQIKTLTCWIGAGSPNN